VLIYRDYYGIAILAKLSEMAVDAALAQLSTAGTYTLGSFSEEDTVHSVFDSLFQYGLVSVEVRK